MLGRACPLILCLALFCPFASTAYARVDPAGVLTGTRYDNVVYGFRIDIPSGWQPASAAAAAAIRKAIAPPENLLLALESAPTSPQVAAITIKVQKLKETFRVNAALGKLYLENARKNSGLVVVREPALILLGGLEVYRADMKRSVSGQETYFALLAVGIKGQILVFQVRGASQTAIDDGVRMLIKAVPFTPDWGEPENQIDTAATRVRISSEAAEKLSVRKVPPIYPQAAKAAQVQGRVVLSASISSHGDVERLWILEGDPVLGQAAVDSVRQWKYQPYLLNGTPAAVFTEVIVTFRFANR